MNQQYPAVILSAAKNLAFNARPFATLRVTRTGVSLGARTIAILMMLALTSCGVVGPSQPLPEEHYYRLELSAPKSAASSLQGVLVVDALEAAAIYSRRPIVYSEDPQHLSLQEYHYHFWTDPPPRLLQRALVSYLRQAQPTATVADEAGRALWDYRISGRVLRFERLRVSGGWQIALELELRVDAAGERRPLLVKSYARDPVASGESMEATVQAFSQGTAEIFGNFVTDLRVVVPAASAAAPEPKR